MLSNPEVIKEFIKAEALNLGFCIVGFTVPKQMKKFCQYQDWIHANLHASMNYLATDKAFTIRNNPILAFPNCKTIISLGAIFPNPNSFSEQDCPSAACGKIASYALGQDYHEVLKKQCDKLIASLIIQTGLTIAWQSAVDTQPLPERELAVQAGLGWIGKNGMLTTRKYGSALVLCEIMFDLALPPDEPYQQDFCGTCTLCIEACPTQCILTDRTLDANRCLSYLTIEHRGEIPDAYFSLMGDRIFGCDTCVSICPWTKNAKDQPRMEALFPVSKSAYFDIDANLYDMTEHFHRLFQHSAIRRTGKLGFLRNCLIHLANTNSAAAKQLMKKITAAYAHGTLLKLFDTLSIRK
jgi:epoxyqueuosine reductase